MEDEGRIGDHTAGIAATDGSWHHIAVSWSSHDGLATLYDNGHKVWLSSGWQVQHRVLSYGSVTCRSQKLDRCVKALG